MNCSDCGLPMEGYGLNHHDARWGKTITYTNGETRKTSENRVGKLQLPEHLGRCCDCTDESFGMPAKNRSRPRPPATANE